MRANIQKRKVTLRIKRKKRVRSKIFGTSSIPRASIFKSNRSLYVQAIDDENAITLASANGNKLGLKANKQGAKELAKVFASNLKAKKIEEVKFDRNGYLYHGVIAEFASALRENGIKL
ncbi:MAG: 50S ribosomal protein L18 [Proteobacteria bacterium]|nr:MAG: 50S ribosomal protein L18 [Pseudomonadota bacterium]